MVIIARLNAEVDRTRVAAISQTVNDGSFGSSLKGVRDQTQRMAALGFNPWIMRDRLRDGKGVGED